MNDISDVSSGQGIAGSHEVRWLAKTRRQVWRTGHGSNQMKPLPKPRIRHARISVKSLIRKYFLPVTRRYIQAAYLTFFGSTPSDRIPTLTRTASGVLHMDSERTLPDTEAHPPCAPKNESSCLLTMSLRSGSFTFVSLVLAGACACSSALANGMHEGGGFRAVSEEFRGGGRAPDDVSMRSNSIRSDVSRYNAERSSPRSPSNGGEPGRPPPMRNSYRTN
jgi:hypothetical protein